MIKSSKLLVENAKKQISNVEVEKAIKLQKKLNYLFVDLRDIRELKKTGKILNAKHVPRGMLEFWIDPRSPYHKLFFSEDFNFIFYCASGWRSALSTLTAKQMGLNNVYNLNGGFSKWIELGGLTEKIN